MYVLKKNLDTINYRENLYRDDDEFGSSGVGRFSCSSNSLLFLINNLKNFCC